MKRDLPTLLTAEITSQQIFDYITHFLYKQGAPSMGSMPGDPPELSESGCAYRGTDNRMCAAGCILPDEIYLPEMEGLDIETLMSDYKDTEGQEVYWGIISKHLKLIKDLQDIHDGTDTLVAGSKLVVRYVYRREFSKVAARFGLKFDPKDYRAQ
jgi:hypothetical protein